MGGRKASASVAGHSHWAGIKHKKAAADAKRGKVFSKHTKAILVAARSGGGDMDANLSLKYAIERAKADNVPKDVIARAVKKGSGELEGETYTELVYEGFAPQKVAVVVDILTDNRNRTAAELRRLFEKKGGTLGNPGSVGWMFEKRGVLATPADGIDEDELMELALEAGADDVRREGDVYEVITSPDAFSDVKKAFEDHGLATPMAEIVRHPSNTVEVATLDAARKVLDFISDLEDHEDVQRVSANFDIPDELMSQL